MASFVALRAMRLLRLFAAKKILKRADYRPRRAPLPREAAERDGALVGALRDMPLCELDGLRRIVLPPLDEFEVFDWFVGRLFTWRLLGADPPIGWTATGCVRTARGLEGFVRPVRGLEGFVRPVRGLEGLMRPVRGLEGLVRTVRGLEGLMRPVRGLEGLMRPVRGLEGLVRTVL